MADSLNIPTVAPHTNVLFGLGGTSWTGLQVARLHAIEEVSQPFRYDVTLRRRSEDGPVDIDRLIDTRASLAVRGPSRWRIVNGVLAEAEETERRIHEIFYRVLLVPDWWRARYRRRCRTFVHKTLREIIASVLENRAPEHPKGLHGLVEYTGPRGPLPLAPSVASFQPPQGYYRWAVENADRLNSRTLRAHVVQYNESDFAFVSRLLEEEGLSYVFEEALGGTVMTITDFPGRTSLVPDAQSYALRGRVDAGGGARDDVILVLRRQRAMRARAVEMRDFSWDRSRTRLNHRAAGEGEGQEAATHYEFPARDENEGTEPCRAPAEHRMQRFNAERAMCQGIGTVRSMTAGTRFVVHDEQGLRPDAELMAVRVETYAVEFAVATDSALRREEFGLEGYRHDEDRGAFFEVAFDALTADTRLRPRHDATPRPRIDGIQTAIVTAEEVDESTEINCDEQGRVRIRFPWDQREPDRSPSSKWVRVSQGWASGGFGHVFTPRVGAEVLVAFLQGDPDRPVIVGRVHNPQTPPPFDVAEHKTRSTIKSHSSPNAEGFNELQFEDKAGDEHIFLHAQKDLNETVLHDHSTQVDHDQSNCVDGKRTHRVRGTEQVTVGGDRTTHFMSNERHTTDIDRTTTIHENEYTYVDGDRAVLVHGDLGHIRRVTAGSERIVVARNRRVEVGNDHQFFTDHDVMMSTDNNYSALTENTHLTSSTDNFTFVDDAFVAHTTDGFLIYATGNTIRLDTGAGASITLAGGRISIQCDDLFVTTTGPTSIDAGGYVDIDSGSEVTVNGSHVSLNS